jgi:heme/copper-type cytochrome/quinol oxidase subunit 2
MQVVILAVCASVAAGVFAAMFLAIWNSRRSSESRPYFHRRAAVEIVWAVIPCMMLVVCAIPAVRRIIASAQTTPTQSAADNRLARSITLSAVSDVLYGRPRS